MRDEEGRLAGFAARRLSDEDRDKPKYVNSEMSGLYRKSELLYGLYEAREAIRREGASFWWKDIRMCWRCMRRDSGIRWRCAGRRFVRGTLLC
ncbi:MAG: hypothetical protein ACLRS8_20285 [Parabacteroides merdae]